MARNYSTTIARAEHCKALIGKPLTVNQIAARMHCDPVSARKYVKVLHDAKEAHIFDWMEQRGTRPSARYIAGPGEDAPRPGPKPHARKHVEPIAPPAPDMSQLVSIWHGWERRAMGRNDDEESEGGSTDLMPTPQPSSHYAAGHGIGGT